MAPWFQTHDAQHSTTHNSQPSAPQDSGPGENISIPLCVEDMPKSQTGRQDCAYTDKISFNEKTRISLLLLISTQFSQVSDMALCIVFFQIKRKELGALKKQNKTKTEKLGMMSEACL